MNGSSSDELPEALALEDKWARMQLQINVLRQENHYRREEMQHMQQQMGILERPMGIQATFFSCVSQAPTHVSGPHPPREGWGLCAHSCQSNPSKRRARAAASCILEEQAAP